MTADDHASEASSMLDEDEKQEQKTLNLARKEDAWVWRLRLLTAVVLIGVAVAACLVVFFQNRNSERDDFEQDFISLGEKFLSSFEANVRQRFGVIDAFGMDITAQANGTFPYVTPADYVPRLQKISELSQVATQMFIPIVPSGELDQWNSYVAANRGWIDQGIGYLMGIDPDDVNSVQVAPKMLDVHSGEKPMPESGPGPYYPNWCAYPVFNNSGSFNINLFNNPKLQPLMFSSQATGKPSFDKSSDYLNGEEQDGRYRLMKRNTFIDYQDDPIVLAFFPVFDSFEPNRTVAAEFLVTIYWRTYFNELLPPGADGVLVILENNCGQQYTYQVDGTTATFFGHGDLHDEKYDYLGVGTSVDSSVDKFDSDFGDGGCRYSIRAYPSNEFEESYYTDRPWIFATILASLFVFTSAVFLVYDWMVERRQNIVMKSAVQSGTLVNSLFPEIVRDQLYAEQEQEEQQMKQEKSGTEAWEVKQESEQETASEYHKKGAIARLYPETTIFFADIVGFTEWSSTRSPSEVFHLLETLYGAFDEIAMKRRIFKVETIGDCYVAAAGLPDPRQDHAVAMVKFASDCLLKMQQLMISLSESLGEDTESLGMRVGLHTGSVTAGVLRGQKSRFQLFGDTVNTTARMESNGMQGRIHASQSTADDLIATGKGTWLMPREGTIAVKGKGEMQTYWVSVPELTSKTSITIRPRPEPESTTS